MFIDELTFWLKQLDYNLELNSIALKAFMVPPSLIPQKPSSTCTSKSKEHSAAIERRLALWKQESLNLLMKEVRFIQEKFVSSRKAKSVEDITRIFARLVMQGKMTAASNLLDQESSTALVTPSRQVLEELEKKHPSTAEIREECLLNGPLDHIPPNIFDLTNEQMIYGAALKTKGFAGPSGMDAELYRRI